ncbi:MULTISPECIES: heme ABC exporter ATP-binding protein CcmA [Brucella/Ochrobactrum group]|uniref:Heme ABC exporter ATP-binding protein CcmA n=2 Tax=Ochrobactrum TaxID=528 RepID=A0ABD5JXS5_9HYPH|nr:MULTISPECIES: heme ABC exporter ATP-binding protein CcmA [Brucella]MCI0999485.1 heme ABC exporter ATP-binding protein CcmA [Ochrobactrum sp. C6C9]RRD27829.1 heme ABC exporter ATP-binding protein CcmA [Brucellaceae bacterium VT-16-1752]WHT41313.1 heme ABC exporter ATP-binding protein CcmA [Ochrobactrum sp. SSR]MDX4075359.1 heme ABC exporter ATP-binding protein CcmA [Brucella sp. NBRC 113783]NNU59013.1 heme ABC exporter ATP-binding protein CcmA [[Ochrobactrum] soli]
MRLEAENLGGERGGETIFSNLSFTLDGGEALVVTGPNGSGKSTLLRIICGLLAPEEGRIALIEDGASLPVQAACHYLGHQNAMKPALSVRENLLFWQRFNGAGALDIDDALEAVNLPGVEHLPFGYLSTGQKRRVSIAKLLVSHRPLWIVDEPTAGLDKASETRFAVLMRDHLQQGGMIIAATHIPLGLEGANTLDMARFSHEAF